MQNISWRNLTPNGFQSFGCSRLFCKQCFISIWKKCEDEFRCWQISRQMRRFFESSLLFFLPRFTLEECTGHAAKGTWRILSRSWLGYRLWGRKRWPTYPSLPHLAPIMVEWKDSRIRKVTIVFRYIGVYPLFPHVPLNHDLPLWWEMAMLWPSSDLQEDELQRVLEDPGASRKELWREALHSVPTVLNAKTSIEVFTACDKSQLWKSWYLWSKSEESAREAGTFNTPWCAA